MVAAAVAGVDPATMGLGPIPASRVALERGPDVDDLDLVELNEAFAAQAIPVMRDELGLDPEKTNVNGGAIAIGPSARRVRRAATATLLHEMRRRGARATGWRTMCIGVGQGIAGGGKGGGGGGGGGGGRGGARPTKPKTQHAPRAPAARPLM